MWTNHLQIKKQKTQEIESLKEKSGQEYNETTKEKEKLMDEEKRIWSKNKRRAKTKLRYYSLALFATLDWFHRY